MTWDQANFVVVTFAALIMVGCHVWAAWRDRDDAPRSMYKLGVQHGREQVRFERYTESVRRIVRGDGGAA